MSNTVLYVLWGALYVLCAGLGFISDPGKGLQFLMTALSVALFIPPMVLSHRSAEKGDRRTLQLVRNLSFAWLVAASILLVCNFLSVLASQRVGDILYGLLIMVASPMVAGGYWALTIFLWAWVFWDARNKLKKL